MMKRIGIILCMAVLLLAGCKKAGLTKDLEKIDSPASMKPDEHETQEGADVSLGPVTAIVTVKLDEAENVLYFQVNDDERLYPTNYVGSLPCGRRAICGLELLGNSKCKVLWIDEIAQGEVCAESPQGADDDGLTLLDDWMTTVEDGFFTLHYATLWGDGSVPHRLAVYTGYDPEDPYQLRLVHSRGEDEALEEADALVFFDINDLPSTGGGYVTLTINWTTREGTAAKKTFPFRTRP